MVGQVCQVRVECCAGELFHRFANHAMEHPPLTHQELCVNRLLRHCVAEGELLCRLLDDELGANELLHQGEQLLLVVVPHLLQHGKIETTPRTAARIKSCLADSLNWLLRCCTAS